MRRTSLSWISGPIAGLLLAVSPLAADDPAAAERQYRVARRLAAEGSPQAADALRKVVELDPRGVLADDALVDRALLENLPRWPEQLGRLEPPAARRALELLGQVIDELGGADRAGEARYYRALLRLEPLAYHDASGARLDLVSVATRPDDSEWSRAARYAGAWLAEQSGQIERATAAYGRLVVDAPGSAAAARARAGLARLALRDGRFGRAARLLHESLAAAPSPGASGSPEEALKELAVRRLLAAEGAIAAVGTPQVIVAGTGIRNLAGMAATPDGMLLADARAGLVLLLGRDGRERARWAVADPQAVAVDPWGRLFVAAGDRVYRLPPAAAPVEVAAQGAFAPVAALAADGLGRLWVLDRRGERIGRIPPGAAVPSLAWESRDARLGALAWDGRRLVATDAKRKGVLAVDTQGTRRTVALDVAQRPAALAVDVTGRIALLDDREDAVLLLAPDGVVLGRFDCKAAGLNRPRAVAWSLDGMLHVFDESSGTWVEVS